MGLFWSRFQVLTQPKPTGCNLEQNGTTDRSTTRSHRSDVPKKTLSRTLSESFLDPHLRFEPLGKGREGFPIGKAHALSRGRGCRRRVRAELPTSVFPAPWADRVGTRKPTRYEGASPQRADCFARSAQQLWATLLQDLGSQTEAATTQEAKRSVSPITTTQSA